MKTYTTFKICTLLLTSLIFFNSCGVSIDVAKRYHQPGFYVNISNDRQSPEDKVSDEEITEVETEAINSVQLNDKAYTTEKAISKKQTLPKIAGETTQKIDSEGTEVSETENRNLTVFAGPAVMLPPGNFYSKNVDADVIQTSGGGGKSHLLALILALVSLLVLVGFGLHRFYLGYTRIGIWQILLTLAGVALAFITVGFILLAIVWVWTLIDVIRIITGDLQPKGGQYSN